MKKTIKALSITFLFSAATASAQLVPLSINGVAGTPAYYDTVLDITWLADWNLAQTNQFGLPLSTRAAETVDGIVSATGKMSWNSANSWIPGMNQANYLGANNWRLPTMQDTGDPGCTALGRSTINSNIGNVSDCGTFVLTTTPNDGSPATTVYSEFASLMQDTLGNKYVAPNLRFHNSGPFLNLDIGIQSYTDYYWTNVEVSSAANQSPWAWAFGPFDGSQFVGIKSTNMYAVAVADGNILDISAVPEPKTYAIFLGGLVLLGFASRRKQA